jgi:serine phosphatase RsbU (regulator of sigma subunit)
VLLFTDGIIESRHAGRFFDFEAEVGVVRTGPPDQALAALVDRLVAFTGGHVGDDVALLLAEYPGRAPGTHRVDRLPTGR